MPTDGVAHRVLPQEAGEPAKTVIALAQRSFGGAGLHWTVTVWLHGALALVQQSTARQVRVATSGQRLLVTVVWMTMVTLVPQQLSVAVGMPNVQLVPGATVMLLGQVSVGGVVSTTVTS